MNLQLELNENNHGQINNEKEKGIILLMILLGQMKNVKSNRDWKKN